MTAIGIPRTPPGLATRLAPGLALTLAIAAIATAMQRLTGIAALSPLAVAMVLGIAWRNLLGTADPARPGITFALRRILRLAIVLLGFQLTLLQLREVGLAGVGVIAVTLVATFCFTTWAGRMLGVAPRLTQLIAAGTSVCGASAVMATNTVTRGTDAEVAYAIACVTVFGSVAMLSLPVLGDWLALDAAHYGIWVGASVHEVAQVAGAAFQHGDQAGQAGMVAKLSRVLLLAPLIVTLGALARRRGDGAQARPPLPWFVLGFVAVVMVNSALPLPQAAQGAVVTLTGFLLTVALAAMGLETDIARLRAQGLRPLILGALATIFVLSLALVLVRLL